MNAQHKIIEILLILSHNNSKYHRICGCGLLLLLWYSSHLAEKLSKYLKCGIMWVCDRVSVWVSLPNPKPKEKEHKHNIFHSTFNMSFAMSEHYRVSSSVHSATWPRYRRTHHCTTTQNIRSIHSEWIHFEKTRAREKKRWKKICCWKWISNKYSAIVLHSEPFFKPQKMLLFNIFNWVERPTDQTKCKVFKF